MTTQILIVDDSAVDRRLVEFFLKKGIDDVAVSSAENGKKALDLIVSENPDLVVSDLQMPEMDGLEMVESIIERGCDVPVILMTGEGSHQIAIKALRTGAASYVPKRSIDRNLVTTVQNVLTVSRWPLSRCPVLSSLVEAEMHFSLENDTSLLLPLVAYLQQHLAAVRLANKLEVTRIGMAIHESLMNAIYFGNLELDSELLQRDGTIFYRLAEERRHDQRYMGRRVRLAAGISEAKVRIVVSDDGFGFQPSKPQNLSEEINLDCIGNRGTLLIHSFMDEVIHNSQGNEITMVKRT